MVDQSNLPIRNLFLKILVKLVSADNSEMIFNPDYDRDNLEEHEIISFGKMLIFFIKEVNSGANKRGNISKRDKVVVEYLLNPARYDPFGK